MIEQSVSKVARLIAEHLHPVAVYVFGSVARGRGGPESDLDMAVFTAAEITFDQSQTVKEAILANCGIELDLIDFNRAPPTLQIEILRHGKKVLVQDEQSLATMIMRAMRSYQMLNEERAPALDKRLGVQGWKRLF